MAHAELDISSEPSQLPGVREFVRAFCHTRQLLDEDGLGQLELAVNEAVANIIRHAHRGCADLRIRIHADSGSDMVMLQLYYGGDAFDPTSVPPPVFDGSSEGGFGLYMIAKSVDHVQYSRDDRGGNCISLYKRSRRSAPQEASR